MPMASLAACPLSSTTTSLPWRLPCATPASLLWLSKAPWHNPTVHPWWKLTWTQQPQYIPHQVCPAGRGLGRLKGTVEWGFLIFCSNTIVTVWTVELGSCLFPQDQECWGWASRLVKAPLKVIVLKQCLHTEFLDLLKHACQNRQKSPKAVVEKLWMFGYAPDLSFLFTPDNSSAADLKGEHKCYTDSVSQWW